MSPDHLMAVDSPFFPWQDRDALAVLCCVLHLALGNALNVLHSGGVLNAPVGQLWHAAR